MVCVHCNQQLRLDPQRGWIHQEGGTYMMRCPDCGWSGAPYPSPYFCPKCGSRNIRDDHCVLPKYSCSRTNRLYRKRIGLFFTILYLIFSHPVCAFPADAETSKASLRLCLVDEGIFRWYSHPGKKMANGKPFEQNALTAAHRTLPLGSWVLAVTEHSRTWIQITDRGPYCLRDGVNANDGVQRWEIDWASENCPYILDLSPAAAEILLGGNFGHNGDGVPYGEIEGRIWVASNGR